LCKKSNTALIGVHPSGIGHWLPLYSIWTLAYSDDKGYKKVRMGRDEDHNSWGYSKEGGRNSI